MSAFKENATVNAWRNAGDSYRRSLPAKDLKRILVPAGPEDVLDEIEKWQQRQKKSKYFRVASGVSAGLSRLQRFSRAIDRGATCKHASSSCNTADKNLTIVPF